MGKYENVKRIIIGGTDVKRVMYMNQQIWPLNITYEIVASSVQLFYSSGDTIFANGTNYAYATGTVITRRGSTEIDRSTKTLTPKTFGGTNPDEFYIPAANPNHIKGWNLHMTETGGYSATVTFVYLTSAETSAVTITQRANTPGQWSTYGYYSFESYSISAPATIAASAESFSVTGTLVYTSRRSRTWTSGDTEYQYAYNRTTTDNPTITSVESTASARFEDNVVYIRPNTGQSNITYNITASYTDPGGVTHTGYTATTIQSYVSYTYGDLSITEFTYAQIPASGNSGHPIYPKVSVSIPVYQGQTLVGNLTGTKLASSASNSMTVSGVGGSQAVDLTFKVDGVTSTYGGATASSLGTNPEPSPTEVAGCQVTATLSGTANEGTEYATVYQQENVPEEISAITLTKSPSTNIPASGGSVSFSASCTFTWTSGTPGSFGTSDFQFTLQSGGNNGKRTYSMSGNELTLGSLGTNYVSSSKTSTIRATNSYAGYADINITEAKNGYTKSLNVVWDFPGEPIPYSGGSTRANVNSATLLYAYESGSSSADTVSAYDILSNTSISGTGFSFSYSEGEYGTVTATSNSGSARTGTLTTTFNGATYVGSVQQSAYVPPVQYTQAYTIGWMGGSNNFTLAYDSLTETYVFSTGDSIISETFSPITSGAVGLTYGVQIELLGNGTDEIAVLDGTGGTVPSSTSTRYHELSSSEFERRISADHLTGYSYVTARVSLVGVSSNLTMTGNSLSTRLII